jgi:uncharacterized protein involved in exopolysaccharide biosynthesis
MDVEGTRMTSTTDKSIDVKHYLRVLWRRKGIVLLSTLCVVCAAFIGLSFLPKQYESTVTLMIEERQPLARDLEAVLGGMRVPGGRYGADEERLGKLVGRIRSRPFLERVIRLLKIHEDPNLRAEADARRRARPEVSSEEIAIRLVVDRLKSRIQFRATGPGIYQIIVADYSPQNAQMLAKWISELFVDITTQNELQQFRTARDFGAEQLRVYEEQLHRSEEALRRLKGSIIQQGLASSMVQPLAREAARAGFTAGDDAIRDDPETLDLVRRIGAALRSDATDRLSVTSGELAPWPPGGTYATLRRDLLQHLEARARTVQPDATPEAQSAAARWAFARVDADVQSDMLRQLETAIESFRTHATAQPGDEVQIARLENDVNKSRQLLESFRAQMVAGDVSQAVETEKLGLQIEILDPAQLPLAAARPDRKKVLLAALLLGPLLGAGFAFLGETMDVTLRSLEDFRRLVSEPILCTTPLMQTLMPRPRGFRRYWVPASMAAVVILTVGFFVARNTVLQGLVRNGAPVRMVNPQDGEQP